MSVSRHDARFAANAFPQLLIQFGEPMVFQSGTASERSIVGIVDREPPVVYDAGGDPIYGDYVVRLTNSATLGILDTEIDRGNQTVTVRSQQSAASSTVTKILIAIESKDSGVLQLRLR